MTWLAAGAAATVPLLATLVDPVEPPTGLCTRRRRDVLP
jgi:hypothetical protein